MATSIRELDRIDTQLAEIGQREYVLTSAGLLDRDGSASLEAALNEVAMHAPAAVLVDLRSLTVLDSSAFAAVAAAARRVRDTGARLVLVADSPDLLYFVGVEGLEAFLEVQPTLGDAIRAVRDQRA